jgi:hypothetical protein
VTSTPAITSTPPARTAAVARSPRKTIAPSTLTTGSRYSSRLILVLPLRTTARFHSSIPATVLPRARNSISPQAGWDSRGGQTVPTSARYGSAPATLEAAVADTGPYFSLSGRSTTVYPPNASVASSTSAAPAATRRQRGRPGDHRDPGQGDSGAEHDAKARPFGEKNQADDQGPDRFGGQQQAGRGRREPLQPDRHRQVVPDHAEQASGDQPRQVARVDPAQSRNGPRQQHPGRQQLAQGQQRQRAQLGYQRAGGDRGEPPEAHGDQAGPDTAWPHLRPGRPFIHRTSMM